MDDLTTISTAPRSASTTTEQAASYPLVTVAVVAHNPGAWFEEVLRSLVAQDYPALDFVVIDAASDEPVTERVHDALPEATVVPLLANQGFAKNANMILDHPTLGPYLLICHDDVALAPDCIRRLIEETLRSNAGVLGPKLLDWNDANRILHVGLGADKTGLVFDLAEPGEYDQEQHDAVRDVFAVPGAVTLMRTDLFQALGGFDEAMTMRGEDLDLCWRAHALGARVMVNPAATARHREDLTTRVAGSDSDRLARRHRIRSVLSNYGLWHTVRVLPQALFASLVNIVVALFQGRISLIVDIVSAWWWNLRRLPSIAARRRRLRRIRQVSDSEVRALQTAGFEGLQSWRRTRADRRADESSEEDSAAQLAGATARRRWFRTKLFVWGGVVAILAFGSRTLITGGVPIFNEFAGFPDGPSPLLAEWSTTWRSTGVGAEAPSSFLHVLLGFGGIALFGQVGLLRLLVTVGMIGVGAVGAYRLLLPFRSVPAQLVALIVYVAAPLPYNALWAGSWSGLVAYAAMPWLAKRLAIAAGISPYGDRDTTFARRLADTVIVGVIVAAAALIEPMIAAAMVLMAVGWIIGSLATRRVDGMGRLVLVTIGALAVGFVLLMPASLGVLSARADWSIVTGTGSTQGGDLGLTDLFRLATGPHGATAVGWAILVLPTMALLLAFGRRLAWAVRCWVVAIGSIGAAWLGEHGTLGVGLADHNVLLAPAALSFALAAAMAAMAFQRDLRRYRFGWRQLVPFVAIAAVVASTGAGLGASLDGRWQVVDDGYESVFSFFDQKAPAHARSLWLGDADVLPVQGWRYDEDLTFAITQARMPTVLDYQVGNPDRTTREIRKLVDETLQGASSRLGQRLALYGIRYVVVVESNAPAPFGTIARPVDPVITGRLGEQLDLVRVEVRPGATIYENRAYVPTVSEFPPGLITTLAPGALPSDFELALPEVTSLRSYRGQVVAGDIYLAAPADTNWALTVDGTPTDHIRAFDWAQAFIVEQPGAAALEHSNEAMVWYATLAQFAVWVATLTVLILGRRRRS